MEACQHKHERTEARLDSLTRYGYNVIRIRECDWDDDRKYNPEVRVNIILVNYIIFNVCVNHARIF